MTNKTTHKLNKKAKIFIGLAAVLLVLIAVWLYLEFSYESKQMKVVSTDAELILSEMPEIELTTSEIEFASTIFDLPVIQQASKSEDTIEIPYEDVSEHLSAIIPDSAENVGIAVAGTTVRIAFDLNNNLYSLFYDVSSSAVSKSINVPELYAKGPDANGEVKEIYTTKAMYFAEYDSSSENASYSKQEFRHVWFGFISKRS